MVRQRVLVRFSKQGDLRLISHRDLLRTLERLFRRAGLNLAMTAGFHPRPRLSFPSALALGIAGTSEVMELELAEPSSAAEVLAAVRTQCLPGLEFTAAEVLPPGESNVPVTSTTYQMAVPPQRLDSLTARIAALWDQDPYWIQGPRRSSPLDLRRFLLELAMDGGNLRIKLRMEREGGVQAREVLAELGLDDLDAQGIYLTRTDVALARHTAPGFGQTPPAAHCRTATNDPLAATPYRTKETETHETRDADQRRPAGGVPHRDR